MSIEVFFLSVLSGHRKANKLLHRNAAATGGVVEQAASDTNAIAIQPEVFAVTIRSLLSSVSLFRLDPTRRPDD